MWLFVRKIDENSYGTGCSSVKSTKILSKCYISCGMENVRIGRGKSVKITMKATQSVCMFSAISPTIKKARDLELKTNEKNIYINAC